MSPLRSVLLSRSITGYRHSLHLLFPREERPGTFARCAVDSSLPPSTRRSFIPSLFLPFLLFRCIFPSPGQNAARYPVVCRQRGKVLYSICSGTGQLRSTGSWDSDARAECRKVNESRSVYSTMWWSSTLSNWVFDVAKYCAIYISIGLRFLWIGTLLSLALSRFTWVSEDQLVPVVERCSCRGRYAYLETCDKWSFSNGAKIGVCDERLVRAKLGLLHARRFAIGDSNRGKGPEYGDSRDFEKIGLRYAITKISFPWRAFNGNAVRRRKCSSFVEICDARGTRRKAQSDD